MKSSLSTLRPADRLRRAQRQVVLGVVMVFTGVGLAQPQPATALLPVIQDNLPEVAEYAHRGGASQSISGVGCGSTCQSLMNAERSQTADTPLTRRVQQRLLAFRQKIGELPKADKLNKAGFFGAASIGWMIGSEVGRQRWLGAIPPPVTTPSSITDVELADEGQSLASGGASRPDDWEVRAPTLGWRGITTGGIVTETQPGGICYPAPNEPIVGFPKLETGSLETDVSCGSVPWKWHFEVPYTPMILANSSGNAPGGIEDYTDQPSNWDPITYWPGQPQTSSELETRVENELSVDSELPARQVAFGLEPQHFPNPTSTEEEDHDCDVSEPRYQNPDSAGTDKHTPYIAQALQTVGRPSGALTAPDPYLRWGEATWTGAGPNAIDSWNGWGYRHIRAKHGWSAADEAATRAALLSGNHAQQTATSMLYFGPGYDGRNGKECRRKVVVEYTVGSTDPPNTPKGIITSYGEQAP